MSPTCFGPCPLIRCSSREQLPRRRCRLFDRQKWARTCQAASMEAPSTADAAREQCCTTCSTLVHLAGMCTVLQKCTSYLGVMAFTWATVVLLGGFASTLCTHDFWVITVILLIEATRFAATLRLSRLLSRPIKHKAHVADAPEGEPASKAGRARKGSLAATAGTSAAAAAAAAIAALARAPARAAAVSDDAGAGGRDQAVGGSTSAAIDVAPDLSGQAPETRDRVKPSGGLLTFCMAALLQAVLPCCSLVLAVWRMGVRCSYESTANVTESLLVFYCLCLASSVCALLCLLVMIRAKVFLKGKPLLWSACYDHLCCRGFSGSVLDIPEFDFLSWGMQQVADELRQGEQIHVIFSLQSYLMLAHYMCGDRYGLLRLGLALESSDPYMQHAAVSMLGYWPSYGQNEVLLSGWLLELVVGKLRKGQVGWAALNTLCTVGRWHDGHLAVQAVLGAKGLATDLVPLLQQRTRNQLAAVRLLAGWLDVPEWKLSSENSKDEIKSALFKALRTPGNMRCSIWAASALLKLGVDVSEICDGLTITADHVSPGRNFTYIWQSEVDAVKSLQKEASTHAQSKDWTVDWDSLVNKGLKIKRHEP